MIHEGRLPENFKRFVTQRCLGYNENYSMVIYANVIELADGTQETVYSWHHAIKAGKITDLRVRYTYEYPNVAHPIEAVEGKAK